MKTLLANPTVRLAIRAALAGLAAGLAVIKASGGHVNGAVISGAATAAGLAFLEAFTPLNQLAGLFKK